MHAKMTRDRKKVFISSVEKTISELEEDNKRMKDIIANQALSDSPVTPEHSPMMTFHGSPDISSVPSLKALDPSSNVESDLQVSKKSLHSLGVMYAVIG
jgi:hypothetical protein